MCKTIQANRINPTDIQKDRRCPSHRNKPLSKPVIRRARLFFGNQEIAVFSPVSIRTGELNIEDMKISRATIDDAEEILQLQKLAYQSEAELYGNYDIPPLRQTVEELKDQFRDHVILKAVSGGAIIGTVRAYEEKGTCHIGRLAVHPEFRKRGTGTALMQNVEGYFHPRRFELFAGSRSEKNLSLYEKLGYTIYKKEKYGCGDIEVFYLEKYSKNIS